MVEWKPSKLAELVALELFKGPVNLRSGVSPHWRLHLYVYVLHLTTNAYLILVQIFF